MNVFTKIEAVREQTSGWCSAQKAETLAAIVIATRPEISLEIGVWMGRSLLPVALAHQYIGKGRVIAVDPWLSGCSAAGQVDEANVKWWGRQDIHEEAHRTFQTHVRNHDLQQFVEIHRMHSDEFDPPEGIGLVSLDGNHGEQSIKDVQRYAPKVKPGGFLVADDLHWSGGSVERAIALLPALGFKELFRVENKEECWAVFQRA